MTGGSATGTATGSATGTATGSTTGSAVLRGRTRAHAFALDTPLIGGAEAARRVFEAWQPGSELRLLPDGRWLLLLPEPVGLRAELGPGLALGEHRSGSVVIPGPGGDTSVAWRSLPTVALTSWLPIADKPVRRLEVLDSPAPPPRTPSEHTAAGAPDLRAAARVRSSDRAKKFHRDLDGPGSRFGTVRMRRGVAIAGTLATVAALVALAVTQFGHSGGSGLAYVRPTSTSSSPLASPSPASELGPEPAPVTTPDAFGATDPETCMSLDTGGAQPYVVCVPADPGLPPVLDGNQSGSSGSGSHWVFLPLPALLAGALGRAYRRRRAVRAAGSGRAGSAGGTPRRLRPPPSGRMRGFLARMTLRSPARDFVRGRHLRYLQHLTEAFERRDYDRALRDAIVLNANRRSTLTRLRIALPRPRTGELVPTLVPHASGGAAPWGPSVYVHLNNLYTEAGTRLEKAGRIAEAAFVYADLLQSPAKAVALLERAGRFREAAELAEGRALEPDLVVRLWWRAGERSRAVDVALARGAFATAIARLEPLDPEASRALRSAWVGALRAAGDHEHAVEVAWPDPALRGGALANVEAGMAVGGVRAARLLAYQNALSPELARAGVLGLLADRDEAARPRRTEFLRAFATVKGAEPGAWDREASTRSLRALVVDQGGALPEPELRTVYATLAGRADPLTAADLRCPAPSAPAPDGRVEVAMPAAPGRLPLADALGLDDGTVLVACGDAGVRILRPDGRTAAAWDVPAHRIVAADHGGCALLVARRDDIAEFRRLDLATRKVEYWTTLRIHGVADSFDGSTLIVVDDDGLAVHAVDLSAGDRPRVIWRELDRGWTVVSLERTPTSVAAWLLDRQGEVNRWRWDLPSWTLRQRTSGLAMPENRWAESSAAAEDSFAAESTAIAESTSGAEPVKHARRVMTFGGEEEAGRISLVYTDEPAESWADLRFWARETAARTTVWDSAGRVAVVERGRVVLVVGVR